MNYILWFESIPDNAVAIVGGKNASLAKLVQHSMHLAIKVPQGFALSVEAYWAVVAYNKLDRQVHNIPACDAGISDQLETYAQQLRTAFEDAQLPPDMLLQITEAYKQLSDRYTTDQVDVAVRSSATAEDLPTASFAGQQESFLNVCGIQALLTAIKACMASLFTTRAIVYRARQGIDQTKVAISVGIQKMVRSDKASSGVMFTLDTETGNKDMLIINAAFGLGEAVVKGLVVPDEYRIYKPLLKQSYIPLIKKACGTKERKLVYSADGNSVTYESVCQSDRQTFCLTDQEIMQLAHAGCAIEQLYTQERGAWCPMDIEWAKDGDDQQLYIVQARPETVYASGKNRSVYLQHIFKDSALRGQAKVLVSGQAVGHSIASGKVFVAESVEHLKGFAPGDVLVTRMTDPDFVPYMKDASALVTEEGGRTSHAAIVSREFGLTALVGAKGAMTLLKKDMSVTVDCSQGTVGVVLDGVYESMAEDIPLGKKPTLSAELLVNIADPDRAQLCAQLPFDGVGLARVEFIIAQSIGMHPMAAVQTHMITDKAIIQKIEEYSAAYLSPSDFFTQTLAQGIAMIAAAFYPRPVIVRFSDFKSNEYRNLLGGTFFEPEEENPMLGLRGASRYYSPLYEPAFALECAALSIVRTDMGFDNVKVMIPFVRTIGELHNVFDRMKLYGLERGVAGLEVIMMCELPSNVILLDQFACLVDGFSIGSNDLTQTTLAVDRDSSLLSPLFNESDPAVLIMMLLAVQGARKAGKPIGICGQFPSDYPNLVTKLLDAGITSLSLNADAYAFFVRQYSN